MKSAGQGKAFRVALTHISELRELAIQPRTTERPMWMAYIWRFLMQKVFSYYHGTREFYSWEGENAAYYIENIDEIDCMMQYEDESPADEFARQTWRKQAMAAVFPTDDDSDGAKDPGASLFSTEDHPWLASNREAKIEELAANLQRSFAVFAKILPDTHILGLTRRIVSHAVRLNEYMMHEAQMTYTVDMEDTTESDDEFYNNLNNMKMAAVNTDSGQPVNMDSAMKGMLQSDIRRRLYKICVIEPAFRSQSWLGLDSLELKREPVKTEVRSSVAVGWALNRSNPPRNKSLFYIMAQSLGIVPLDNSSE